MICPDAHQSGAWPLAHAALSAFGDQAWIHYSLVANLTCSILSRNALMPASLDIKQMRSCPELSNHMPEMLVAAILLLWIGVQMA